MPRFEGAAVQQPKPGEELIAGFESLKDGADSDAAVEFVYKNRDRVTADMDSEEAWDLLKKLPRRTQDASYGEMLRGALQVTSERSMKAEPGTDMAEAFKKRGSQTGVAFLEKNLNVIDPEQVADIIAKLKEIDFPHTDDANERRKQDQFKERVDALLENVESIQLLEAKRDAPQKPDLHVVSPVEAAKIQSARDRVDTLQTFFDAQKGFFDENAKRKVEAWQQEVEAMRPILGDEVHSLSVQMEKYALDADRAQKARAQVAVSGAQQRASSERVAARPQTAAKPTQASGILGKLKFWK
ncbi:MAG: hypothetical protein UT32_C0005G0016 [Parcubacteria group bacterium GW2011_GWC2_39_14]|nr:MAG: hypothetical protein UT32_C0005G0016 [Parcubacteria group bacterium GW2011_GWC2_39_14]KKR54597.1 MAG: hypothetical protein UT91_C0012G0016 [Parcubacteria group bacterium GW2011_GWA2_40_23]